MKSSKNILVMALMVLFFEGCNKDDPAPDQSAELIGSWEAVSFVSSNCKDPLDNGTTTCTSFCEILVFTATTVTFDGEGPYNYTTNGNSMTIDFGDDETITYFISGTTLTFTNQDSPADGGCKNVSTYKKYDFKVTDIDGNVYNTVIIGTQEWMKENLKTKHYSDGSVIPNVTQTVDWVNLSSGAYCDFDNNTNNVATYGRLYNWYAVADNRNVCPSGWHAPSLEEWDVLINTLGGESIAGGKMKSTGTLQNQDGLWYSPNTGATNSSGFTGLPAGTRFDAGDFRDLHSFGSWWSTDGDFGSAWSPRLQDTHTMVEWFNNYARIGKSVRCVKD